MKKIIVIILILPHILSAQSKKSDSLAKQKMTMHGLSLRVMGYPYFYMLSYKFLYHNFSHSFGVSFDATVNPRFNPPSGKHYANFYLGITPIAEFGKKWGFHIGLQNGIALNPVIKTKKLLHIPPSDRPNYLEIINGINLGLYYHSKNKCWQFLLNLSAGISTNLYYSLQDKLWEDGMTEHLQKRWNSYFTFFLPSFTFVYYIKISQK